MRFTTYRDFIMWKIANKDWASDPTPEEARAMQKSYEGSSPGHRLARAEAENARLRARLAELERAAA